VTLPEDLSGDPIETARPRRFFDQRGPLGEATRFAYVRPAGCEHLTDEQLVALVRERIEAGEAELAAQRGDKPVLGATAVLKQHWNSQPKTRAPRFQRDPHVACRDRHRRIAALLQLAAFRDAYRTALGRFRAGRHNAVFPHGTLMMRERFGVRCATACPAVAPPALEPPSSAPPSAL
jgi:hypothetical protein